MNWVNQAAWATYTWATQVPATVWVATGALIGVFITNRSNATRQSKQFDHERQQNNEDRDLALKKDIYLDAASAIAENLQALILLSNLEIPVGKAMKKAQQNGAALAKIQLIGGESTLKALNTFAIGYTKALYELLPGRISLDVRLIQNRAITDPAIGRAAARELMERRLLFIQKCSETSFRCTELLPPLVHAMRDELGLPIEMSLMKDLIDGVLAAGQEGVKDLPAQVMGLVEEAGAHPTSYRAKPD